MGDNSDNRVAESVHGSTRLGHSTVPVSVEDIDAAGLQHVARFVERLHPANFLAEATCKGTYPYGFASVRECDRHDGCGLDDCPSVTATPPVNHPGNPQQVTQPAASPPISDEDTVVVDVPHEPYNHVVEIVRLDGELARERELTAKLKAENKRLRDQLTAVARRAIDDVQQTPLRTWIRQFFSVALVGLVFVVACGDDTKRISDVDAATIQLTDARACLPTRIDAGSGQQCTMTCEALGCTKAEYEATCTKGGTVCMCNGVECEGTP